MDSIVTSRPCLIILFSGGVYNGSLRGLLDYALLCAGSSFTVGVAESAPEPAPSQELAESAPEPRSVPGSLQSRSRARSIQELAESAPEPAPSQELAESAPEPAPSQELAESRSRARSVPGACRVRSRGRSDPGAHKFAPEAAPIRSSQSSLQSRSDPGASQSPHSGSPPGSVRFPQSPCWSLSSSPSSPLSRPALLRLPLVPPSSPSPLVPPSSPSSPLVPSPAHRCLRWFRPGSTSSAQEIRASRVPPRGGGVHQELSWRELLSIGDSGPAMAHEVP